MPYPELPRLGGSLRHATKAREAQVAARRATTSGRVQSVSRLTGLRAAEGKIARQVLLRLMGQVATGTARTAVPIAGLASLLYWAGPKVKEAVTEGAKALSARRELQRQKRYTKERYGTIGRATQTRKARRQ